MSKWRENSHPLPA